jgi:hypothetical protein
MVSPNENDTTDLLSRAFEAQRREYQRKKSKPRILALEYFVAGLPPLLFFEHNLDDLDGILGKHHLGGAPTDALSALGLIGLAAYFEAFCKDLFAALVNMCPQLLDQSARFRDCEFKLPEVRHLIDSSQHRIGSILSEHYDWGSAHSVNGLFGDLLKISPFSKDEAKKYGEFLNDRNLLVHHGGVYTFKYAGQKFAKKELRRTVHWQSITVRKADVSTWVAFLHEIAKKASLATKAALAQFVNANNIELGKERTRALKLLTSGSGGWPPVK